MNTMIVPSHTAMKTATTPQKPTAIPKGLVASIQQVLSMALGKKPTPVKSDKPPPNPKQYDPDKEIIIGDKRYVLQDETSAKHDTNTVQWHVTMCECTSDSSPSTSDRTPSIGIGPSDKCTYNVSNHQQRKDDDGALVGGGANGGVNGNDVCVIAFTGCSINITGLDHHQITDKPLVTAGNVTETHAGPVIPIMHQHAYHGRGRTILSPAQLEAFGIRVSERHCVFGGLQAMVTPDGYVIPIKIHNGLPYIPM